MSANASQELTLIKSELQSIIDELHSIAGGVKRDFDGIGEDRCAASLNTAAEQYAVVKQKLNSMNLSIVTEEFAARKRAEEEAARRAAEAAAKAAAEAERRRQAEAAAAKAAAEEAERKRQAEEAAKKNANKNSSNSSNKNSNKKSGLEKLWEDITGWLF